jgi:F0F1-type ATP synthase assembly protein I
MNNEILSAPPKGVATKKSASNTNIAVTLYVTTNLLAALPLFFASLIAERIGAVGLSYILINCLLVLPTPYFALKYAASHVNSKYIITDKKKVISSVIKYLLVLNGLFLIGSYFYTGYLSLSMVVGAFIVLLEAIVISKYAPEFIHESSPDEIAASSSLLEEPHIGKSVARTAWITILGFIFLLVTPFAILIMYSEQLGSMIWLVLAAYFTLTVFLFRKFFFSKPSLSSTTSKSTP